MSRTGYDHVIVGGGSAGCVLANRLSDDPSNEVLVLEAGRPDRSRDVLTHMPAALTMVIGNRFHDWRYHSEPEPYMNGRRVSQGRGRLLGGSGSVNGMIFQRGNPMDLERWAADPGMETRDYAHCLPYFKKMEHCVVGGDDRRGRGGPLWLERGPATNPLFGAFLEAVQQAGHPLTSDVNGHRQEGFARFDRFDRTIRNGRRRSASRAYLHPVLRRPNLTVRCFSQVDRILFSGKRAVGVAYRRLGRRMRAYGGEVVLCGGAFNTPQLLRLSGIGSPDELRPPGVEMVHALPGVGENLQDHLEVHVQHACKQPVTLNPALKPTRQALIGLQWLLFRTGPAATDHFEAGGFVRGNTPLPPADVAFHRHRAQEG